MVREPTLGEIAENLNEVKESLRTLTELIDRTYMRKDVYDANHDALAARVGRMEERFTWVGRTALTALVLPIVVTLILTFVLASGGLK